MPLGRRSTGPAQAVYARVLDGATLWLAVRTDAPALTLRVGADEIPLPVETAGGDPTVLTTRFALLEALAGHRQRPLVATVHAGAGRRAVGVAAPPDLPGGPLVQTPTSPDGCWQLSLEHDDGALLVVRRAAPRTVPVLGFAERPDGVELRLRPTAATAPDECRVISGAPPVPLPVTREPGRTTALLPTGLGRHVADTGWVELDGAPLVRHANQLVRPNQAVTLPVLAPDLELRWRADGRLVLKRASAGAG